MSSCSIAGSWVYERLDNYLADYFKEFADFSREQDEEIEIISTEFINWFSENELSKVKVILEKLKSINLQNPEKEIVSIYRDAEGIFRRSNFYFKLPIISFTKELNEVQIDEIGSHFRELREKREKERSENGYSLIDNYISGFDRVGIKLRDDQIDKIKLKLENHIEVREEWSNLQEEWIEEFIQLLKNNQSPDYETKMSAYLDSLEELGEEKFREKIDKNELLAQEIISFVFKSSDEKQIENFNRSLDIYIKSIKRILSRREVN
ncbi:hypothetical protein M9C81_00385 [SAR86 cluster bacterium]|nr:hypothetical protein M9C81_00385 [SAR86 cluster bacterium]